MNPTGLETTALEKDAAFDYSPRTVSHGDAIQSGDLDILLANLREGVIALDHQARICFCNPAALKLLEINPDHVMGRPFAQVIEHPELQRAVQSFWVMEKIDTARKTIIETGGTDRRLLDVAVRALPREAASGMGWVIYLADMTEIAQSARMKADFVANASHELRTPLSTMKAATETLLESLDRMGGHERRFVEVLNKNVERLEHLVQDLLDLNRVESPMLKAKFEEVHLLPLLQEIQRDYAGPISTRGLTVVTELEAATLKADRKLLKLVLTNLFDNAVKFVPSQTGRITLRCRLEGVQAIMELQDNGIGIPSQDQERVFERFYQVDKARTESGQAGTGLGLAIVKHAMAAMGGAIEIDAAVCQGTLMRLRIPQINPL